MAGKAGEPSGGVPRLAGFAVREAILALTRAFEAASLETPAIDARRLVAGALGLEAIDLLRDPSKPISVDEASRLEASALRRLQSEPVSRILGERGFYGRMFAVTPATLDPRPCSETLIEAVLEIASAEGWRERPIRILDVGTGTGCLLLTLLAELPLALGLGTDVSSAALAVAKRNGERLGLADRVRFLERSYLTGIDETFDLLISNPPYIPAGDIAGLDADVRLYDPMGALDGGPDGLDAYRALSAGFVRVVPRGWAVFEVGAGQAADVAALLCRAPGGVLPGSIRHWNDLGGHQRCVAIKSQSYP